MKLKLDENLPESLVAALAALGHDVDNVRLEGVVGENDPKVWRAAQQAGRFFITQDLDFSDMRHFRPGTHHGLMLVRLRAPGRRALAARITEAFHSARPIHGHSASCCSRTPSCAFTGRLSKSEQPAIPAPDVGALAYREAQGRSHVVIRRELANPGDSEEL